MQFPPPLSSFSNQCLLNDDIKEMKLSPEIIPSLEEETQELYLPLIEIMKLINQPKISAEEEAIDFLCELKKKYLKFVEKGQNNQMKGKSTIQYRDTAPALWYRVFEIVNLLWFKIGEKRRIPVPYSLSYERSVYHQNIKEIFDKPHSFFQLQTPKNLIQHLVNYIKGENLNIRDLQLFQGNLEIWGLESWSQILTHFIKTEKISQEAKMTAIDVHSIIQRSIPLSLKTSFAFYLPQIIKKDNEDFFSDVEYLKFLKPNRQDIFYSIPENVIINELAWDMMDSIDELKVGKRQIFLVGCRIHRVVVEIMRQEVYKIVKGYKIYQYKIYNTGLGSFENHGAEKIGNCAYPLIFENVKKNDLSYSFFIQLLRIALKDESIEKMSEFYLLHNRHFKNTGQLLKSEPYSLQKFNDCAYFSISAWIQNFFQNTLKNELSMFVTQLMTGKLERYVKYLKKDLTKINSKSVSKKIERKFNFEIKIRSLIVCQKLLKLSQELEL